MNKVFYLHGLGSGGQASTALALRNAGLNITAPDYAPQDYTASIALLTQLITKQQPALLAGTSMGGYYALKLAELTGIPCLAVNACFEPALSLSKYLQQPAEDYANGGVIHFTPAMLNAFTPLNSAVRPAGIVIGRRDESIPADYQQAFCEQMGWHYQFQDWGHRVEDAQWLATEIRKALTSGE
ncbi:YqiA/YcfP family alpha/beta fold hydrolase [Aliamphritea hakodatensis]|uniref:YqiA/YcfP family alpha/beta fold hydrolase n=1 Tax=Aliamphritea hakodatensis TaxID=2895352 RepID=UPI0022FD767B|nr:YqiA/YcfP family alpha/beta fold hydrolase [Aliamphritea hakodatensis]